MTRTRSSIPTKIAAALIVAVVFLLGIWVSGGWITNDFKLAMFLTVAWSALAGAVVVAIAIRRRDLRLPVLGAYVLAAAAVAYYLGSSLLGDDVVDEKVARAGPAAVPGAKHPPRNRNVELARGRFESVQHSASGVATAIRLARGGRVLTLTGFAVSNGPDLRVRLVAGPARDESEVKRYKDLGGLKGNKGNQQYELPGDLDLRRYGTAVIWCRAFSVEFARAPLARR